MNNFHASFSILGEVTEMLIVQKPVYRLLVDISAHPDTDADRDISDFLHRTTFSVLNPLVIADLQDQVSTGDVIEAEGTFWQSGYVPHKEGYVDTTFYLSAFRVIEKQLNSSVRHNPYKGLFPHLSIH
jgi:hypothetical protein